MGQPSGLTVAFGRIVREVRKREGLSQETLAEKAGVHPTYISMIERGVKNASLLAAAKVAHALGCTLWEMVRAAEDPTPRGPT